jgi:2-polyprenyl-6-methoxyphenol hydroxylase-like FAD-dependent oxidoreductase
LIVDDTKLMPVVLIICGGIAGTAAALALDKTAIDATVYEAHPVSSQDRGAFLTLASNGMHALRQIEADTVVCAVSAPLRTMRVCADQGHEIATVALGETYDPATGYRYLTRAALCSALQREAQDRGIRIKRGKRLTQVTAHRRGVTAVFSDGSRACGDVLIGADGLHSLVRTLLNPTASAPRYAGERVFYGYSTNTGVDSPPIASKSSGARLRLATSSPSRTTPGGFAESPTPNSADTRSHPVPPQAGKPRCSPNWATIRH